MKKETAKKTKEIKKEVKEVKNVVNELEAKLDEFFSKKVWQLPKKAREIIVKILPYLAVLGLVAIIPMVLMLLGFSFLTPFYFLRGIRWGLTYSFSLMFLLVNLVLIVVVIPGLFQKEKKVWTIMFWMTLINAVGAILSMDLGRLIIGTGLSWYILFQIKEYYKK